MTKNYSRIEAENHVQDYMQAVSDNLPIGVNTNAAGSNNGPSNPKQYVVGEFDNAPVPRRVIFPQIVGEFGLLGVVEERIQRGTKSEDIVIYELGARKLVGYTILDT